MNQIINEINNRLVELLSSVKNGKVKEAMLYSLTAPGKRIRPLIFLTVLRSYKLDYKQYIDIACAIEMIHTYSLIHDDLPGMDNDDLRRGQPTCHKKFDEATAILAGDALLNQAVNVICNTNIESSLKVAIINRLYSASGVNGMIYGQQQDLYYENKSTTLDELKDIHRNKTGELIAVSMQLASMIANKSDYDIWTDIGFDLGLAFQIQDDVLDVTSDTETLGKQVGSDLNNNKSTYVKLLGVDECNRQIDLLFKQCLENIYKLKINHGLIIEIIEMLNKREK